MKTLALFDFDGTITQKDTLSEFLRYIHPKQGDRFFLKYVITLPHIVLYKLGLLSSDTLKKARLHTFFQGKTYSELEVLGKEFVHNNLDRLVKKSATVAIDQHLANGDDVYIVSASIDIILNPWCKQRNLQLITNVIDPQSLNYVGSDCNDIEKVRKIRERIDLTSYDIIYAYGDTVGDMPMLELAHKKYYQYFI